jgi:hypothetical protein
MIVTNFTVQAFWIVPKARHDCNKTWFPSPLSPGGHSRQAKNVKYLIICLQALKGRTTSAQGEALCLN